MPVKKTSVSKPKKKKTIEKTTVKKITKKKVTRQRVKKKDVIKKQDEHLEKDMPLAKDEHVFIKKEVEEIDDVVDLGSGEETEVNDNKDTNITEKQVGDIDKSLAEIYENSDGSMPDMQNFQKGRTHGFGRAMFVFLLSCVLFAVVAWVGMFVIQPRASFNENDVLLSINGDSELMSGDLVSYRVKYRNTQHVDLEDVALELKYPKGFQFVSSSVESGVDTHDVWHIASLKAGESGFIDVSGHMYVSTDEDQSFRAFLNYKPSNFSSQFQQVAHIAVSAMHDQVGIQFEAPDEISVDTDTAFRIVIQTKEGIEFSHMIVACEGNNFSAHGVSQPDMVEGKNCMWTFDNVTETKEISFSGSFVEEGQQQIHINVYTSPEQADDERYRIAEYVYDVDVVRANTSFRLAVNGGVGDMDIQPGDTINASLILKNNGDVVMDNAEITLFIKAPSFQNRSILDWGRIDTTESPDIFGKQISDEVRQGELVWNSSHINALKKVSPGQEIHIDVGLPIKNADAVTLADFINHDIALSARIRYSSAGEEKTSESNDMMLRLISDVDLRVQDDITKDEQENIIHRITWLLSNSFHSLKDIDFEADVYGDVDVLEEDFVVPAGTLSYDTEQKKIVWHIDEMPQSVDVLAAQFDIHMKTVNPSQSQLMSKVKGRVYDTLTEDAILISGDEILLNNENAGE